MRIMAVLITVALATLSAACSSSTGRVPEPRTVRTVLLTSPHTATVYSIEVFDSIVRDRFSPRARFDTSFLIGESPAASMYRGRIERSSKTICLRFDLAELGGDSILGLVAHDPERIYSPRWEVYINVARNSWTWEVAAPAARVAPPC